LTAVKSTAEGVVIDSEIQKEGKNTGQTIQGVITAGSGRPERPTEGDPARGRKKVVGDARK